METAQPLGRFRLTKFGNPDFVKLVESMGLKHVQATGDLIPTLRQALKQPVPSIIDCPLDHSEHLYSSQRSQALVCEI